MTDDPAWMRLLANAVNARDRAVAERDELAAERDALAAENRRLREQIASLKTPPADGPDTRTNK